MRNIFLRSLGDTQTALEKYLAAALHTARQPTPEKLHSDELTVKDISNQYLTYQSEKVKTNDLRPRTFAEYRSIVECFAKFVGPTRVVSDLTPFDFQRFRNKLAQKGLQNNTRSLGVHALSSRSNSLHTRKNF